MLRLALKVDVDTDRGTRIGVPNLIADCEEYDVPACFLFSLGPDQTGRAITRVFRPLVLLPEARAYGRSPTHWLLGLVPGRDRGS